MAEASKSIDISDMPQLRELAEDVRARNEPRILVRDNEVVAVIVPISTADRLVGETSSDLAAFYAAAGSWKGNVDTEKLKQDILESRRISTRPPVDL
jgi:hypothetical protein